MRDAAACRRRIAAERLVALREVGAVGIVAVDEAVAVVVVAVAADLARPVAAVGSADAVGILAVGQAVVIVVEAVGADLRRRRAAEPVADRHRDLDASGVPRHLAAGRVVGADRVAARGIHAEGLLASDAAGSCRGRAAEDRVRIADEANAIKQHHRVEAVVARVLDADRVAAGPLRDRHHRGRGLPAGVADRLVSAGEVDPLDREVERVVDRLDGKQHLGAVGLDEHDPQLVVELGSDVLGPLLRDEVVVEADAELDDARLHHELAAKRRRRLRRGGPRAQVRHVRAVGRKKRTKARDHRHGPLPLPRLEAAKLEAAVEGRLERIDASRAES